MEKYEEAAKSLRKSMKGIGNNKSWFVLKKILKNFLYLGTDESRLIKEIINHSNSERQSIKEIYLTMYGKVSNQIL